MAHLLDVARQSGSPFIVESIADQIANAAALYLEGSQIQVPSSDLRERTSICWKLWMTKTAAGVGAPAFNIRVGQAGTIADTSRLAFALGAQTAVADTAIVEITALIREGGAAAVIAAVCKLSHGLAATGFATVPTEIVDAVSAPFDLSGNHNVIGLSVNPGDGVWTVRAVITELSLT